MTFTPKVWHDAPDGTTPIQASSLVDLETRLAAYIDASDAQIAEGAPSSTLGLGTLYFQMTSGVVVAAWVGNAPSSPIQVADLSGVPATGSVSATQVAPANIDGNPGIPSMRTLDTDGTLTANSDTHTPSQKAVKTYADTKAPGIPTDSYRYIPGIVTGGSTDNLATINSYLSSLAAGGQTNLVLPPGLIGVSGTVVPPANVTLRGSGGALVDTTPTTGSVLVPTSGFTGTNVVSLDNNNSGIRDLAINASAGAKAPTALRLNATYCVITDSTAYGGTTTTFTATTSNLHSKLVNFTVTVASGGIDTSTIACMDVKGSDMQSINGYYGGGTKFIAISNGLWTGDHLINNSGAGATNVDGYKSAANIVDFGNQNFVNCSIDGVHNAAVNAIVDRSQATGKSIFTGCFYEQSQVLGAISAPFFLETTTANCGASVIGGRTQTGGGVTFTNFIKGAIASTVCLGVQVGSSVLSSTFTDSVPPLGIFHYNTLSGTPQDSTPSSATITSTNASWPIPAGAQTLRITCVGGGGQGGGGGSSQVIAPVNQVGGGGGAAGTNSTQIVSVGINTTLNVTIGAGGSAAGGGGAVGSGASGNAGTSGSNGANSTVTGTGISILGSGGRGGVGSAASSTTIVNGGTYGGTGTGGAVIGGSGGPSAGSSGFPINYSPSGGAGGGSATSTNGGTNGGSGTAAGNAGAGTNGGSGTAAGTSGGAATTLGAGGGGGGGGAASGAGGNGASGASGFVIIDVIA